MKKRVSSVVYADVTHTCNHTVRYEFTAPKDAREHDAHSQELKRKATEPCDACQRRR